MHAAELRRVCDASPAMPFARFHTLRGCRCGRHRLFGFEWRAAAESPARLATRPDRGCLRGAQEATDHRHSRRRLKYTSMLGGYPVKLGKTVICFTLAAAAFAQPTPQSEAR